MEEHRNKAGFLEEDIVKFIQDISYLNQTYTQCNRDRQYLEKQVDALNKKLQDANESIKLQITELTERKQLITDQQSTISKLVSIKNEFKRLKDDIATRDKTIDNLEKEIVECRNSHILEQITLANEGNEKLNALKNKSENEIKELKSLINIMTSEAVCNARKIEEEKRQLETEKDETMNRLVFEYEEKLQRAHAYHMQIKDENRAIVENYKKKIYILEQKQHPRTNIIAPNIPKNTPMMMQPKNSYSYEDHYNKTPILVEHGKNLSKPVTNSGAFKLSTKSGVTKRNTGNYKPLPITKPTFSNEGSTISIKKKLFNKTLDEYQEE